MTACVKIADKVKQKKSCKQGCNTEAYIFIFIYIHIYIYIYSYKYLEPCQTSLMEIFLQNQLATFSR